MIRTAARHLTRTVGQTVTHPLAAASYAVGVARGVAAEAIRLASGAKRVPPEGQWAMDEPQRVPLRPGERHQAELAAAALVPDPPRPGPEESFAHEPHAASRASAHGDGPLTDAEVDRWQEDAEDTLRDEDLPLAEPAGDEPLLNPSFAKQVRSEAETMRKGARNE